MIRIIVRTCDARMAANVGGEVETVYKTFDFDLPELERFMIDGASQTYSHRQIIGAEVLPELAIAPKP